MNYRHSYHAGNHADVFKHALLRQLLVLMQRKQTPLCCLDSHAGTAFYDLQGEAAGKTGEYVEGIGRLWARDDLPLWLADYRDAVCATTRMGSCAGTRAHRRSWPSCCASRTA